MTFASVIVGACLGLVGAFLGALLSRRSARETNEITQRGLRADFERFRSDSATKALIDRLWIDEDVRLRLVEKFEREAAGLGAMAVEVWVLGRAVSPKNWPVRAGGQPHFPVRPIEGWETKLSELGLDNPSTQESAVTGVLAQYRIYLNHAEAATESADCIPALVKTAERLSRDCGSASETLRQIATELVVAIDRLNEERRQFRSTLRSITESQLSELNELLSAEQS